MWHVQIQTLQHEWKPLYNGAQSYPLAAALTHMHHLRMNAHFAVRIRNVETGQIILA